MSIQNTSAKAFLPSYLSTLGLFPSMRTSGITSFCSILFFKCQVKHSKYCEKIVRYLECTLNTSVSIELVPSLQKKTHLSCLSCCNQQSHHITIFISLLRLTSKCQTTIEDSSRRREGRNIHLEDSTRVMVSPITTTLDTTGNKKPQLQRLQKARKKTKVFLLSRFHVKRNLLRQNS